ncbi:hypothetical protein AB395_0000667 [Sinorhizobium fredii CCBAU 45436]|nr:hypothetical protein SF83666_c06410 [Sinorhizobium fredii CCBAU 83666]AWI56345.1 hypothetical protein AB395_0000667 [Sinorhizobium fredii CCBAU 45436]AWM24140.1 hypothetical protein AOX55_0000863 [Sinorhizobium fredii CCBAU 25509]
MLFSTAAGAGKCNLRQILNEEAARKLRSQIGAGVMIATGAMKVFCVA